MITKYEDGEERKSSHFCVSVCWKKRFKWYVGRRYLVLESGGWERDWCVEAFVVDWSNYYLMGVEELG